MISYTLIVNSTQLLFFDTSQFYQKCLYFMKTAANPNQLFTRWVAVNSITNLAFRQVFKARNSSDSKGWLFI